MLMIAQYTPHTTQYNTIHNTTQHNKRERGGCERDRKEGREREKERERERENHTCMSPFSL